MTATPRAERPTSPEWFPESPQPLPWRWARTRLEASRNYWLSTISRSGFPHARPVWGVWVDDEFWFDTGSRLGVHVGALPRITVHLESGDECVIVEGIASRETEVERTSPIMAMYNTKYGWVMPPQGMGAVFRVTPRVVYGWLSDSSANDSGTLFGNTATRWVFDES